MKSSNFFSFYCQGFVAKWYVQSDQTNLGWNFRNSDSDQLEFSHNSQNQILNSVLWLGNQKTETPLIGQFFKPIIIVSLGFSRPGISSVNYESK